MTFCTSTTDPMAEYLADPLFRDAYLDAVCRDYEERSRFIDEDDLLHPDACTPAQGQEAFDAFLDIDHLARRQRALVAEQDHMIDQLLTRAGAGPEPWVGPDPALDPAWRDPRDRDVATVRRHRREFAVRAAAADLATRLRVSENTIRCRAHRARVLSRRCPLTWRAYLDGDITEQNAATAATLVDTLPARAPEAWHEFDETLADAATSLAPGRFRTRARAVRERVHPTSLTERRARAMEDRGVWIRPDLDGMATLTALLPAEKAHALDDLLESHARHLAGRSGDTRTVEHIRADVFCDLSATTSATCDVADDPRSRPGNGITATVNLTIPALTLLGRSDEPATLDGYGPIDIDTARELAGTATSFVRVLTHPVTSTTLDVDRKTYRIPADLRRWLRVHHPTCVFPGCQKPAGRCDIDHRKRWSDGGTTSAENTAPLCERHHVLKDETLWRLHRATKTGTTTGSDARAATGNDAGTAVGELSWISPSGNTIPEDPPPF